MTTTNTKPTFASITHTIRPGLLLGLHTEVSGGVQYDRRDLSIEDIKPRKNQAVSRWETTRIIDDPKELEAATKIRNAARALITSVCAQTKFGPVCPEERRGELDAAIVAAHELIDTGTKDFRYTRVCLHVMIGHVSSDDVQAAQGIAAEIGSLLTQMEEGIKKAKVKDIREAASRAKQMLAILSDDTKKAASRAINEARKAARSIVSQVEKKGESLAVALQDVNLKAITRARFAFLDLSVEEPKPDGKRSPQAPLQRFAAVGE